MPLIGIRHSMQGSTPVCMAGVADSGRQVSGLRVLHNFLPYAACHTPLDNLLACYVGGLPPERMCRPLRAICAPSAG